MKPPGPRVASLSLLPLVAILAASTNAVWLSVRTGSKTVRYSGLDIPVIHLALVLLIVIIMAGALVEGMVLQRWPLSIPAIAGSIFAILAVMLLILEEVAASLIPTSFLPESARRLSVNVYGGSGIWIGCVAAPATVLASRFEGGCLGLIWVGWLEARRLPLKWIAALVASGLLVCLALWVRYLPWATASAGTYDTVVPGWALPGIGPVSMVAVLVLAAAFAVLLVRQLLGAALVLAFVGWLLSFLAAIALVSVSSLASVHLDRYFPVPMRHYSPRVEAIDVMSFLQLGCCWTSVSA